jgi:hypothetical protein
LLLVCLAIFPLACALESLCSKSWADRVLQEVEHLHSKHKALSSSLSTITKKKPVHQHYLPRGDCVLCAVSISLCKLGDLYFPLEIHLLIATLKRIISVFLKCYYANTSGSDIKNILWGGISTLEANIYVFTA